MKTGRAVAVILMALALAWACDDDGENPYETPKDTYAPARIVDLAVDSVTAATITLTWTAPGDDGNAGRATSYTLKRSGAAIDASNFAAATTVSGVPAPATAGTAESFAVPGLDSTLTYYFAIRAVDDAGNAGAVSNNANWTDTYAPARIVDLAVDSVTAATITLTWTAPGDDGNAGRATSYTLKRSGAAIDASNFAAATTVSGVPAPATAGTAESFTVSGLDSMQTYYFAIHAVDEADNSGDVSNNAIWTPRGPIHLVKSIPSFRDNTLYEELGLCLSCPGTNGVEDSLSNGAGEWVFAGRTNNGDKRRALLAFAIADSLPSGATVDSVTLTLTMSRSISGAASNALHRVTADWGEGTSDASCCAPQEGTGGSATAGDATWLQRVFRTSDWTTPGGDFAAAPSATRSVGDEGPYGWQSAQMAADVQGWLDSPATNFGWIMIGDESAPLTTKRYDAHESAATRPILTVYYTVPAP